MSPAVDPAGGSGRSGGPATARDPLRLSREILERFADATGVTSERPPRRYLWTDAFAVCGFLGLHAETGEGRFLETARQLVDQVHHVLGRHRDDDPREGWISGHGGREAEEHPTSGGLRIGKPEPERRPGEPYDPVREWSRDGQYYHYLTKWMHALNRMWRVTGEPRFHRWAVELARAAHAAFVEPGAVPGMNWKMSVDLSRPLVPSTGHHDPLDGRITLGTLQATAPERAGSGPPLERECEELEAICRGRSWTTDDALGVGGLLTGCLRIAQIRLRGRTVARELRVPVLHAARASLAAYARKGESGLPAERRLAFRELGLAVGLRAVERLGALASRSGDVGLDEAWLEAVCQYRTLAEVIETFWAEPEHRRVRSWMEHEEINDVMLAIALKPAGYLDL